jgi:hypothetical protein
LARDLSGGLCLDMSGSSDDESESKSDRDSDQGDGSPMSVSPPPAAVTDASTYEGIRLTTGGLTDTMHGNVFQLGILTLAAHRARLNGCKDFVLISEAKEFEKFDDLVLDQGLGDPALGRIFLQAKHSSSSNDKYTRADFQNTPSHPASLAKYFDSWWRLKKKFNDGKAAAFLLFTNSGVDDAVAEDMLDAAVPQLFQFEGFVCRALQFNNARDLSGYKQCIRAYSEVVASEFEKQIVDCHFSDACIARACDILLKKWENKAQSMALTIGEAKELPIDVLIFLRHMCGEPTKSSKYLTFQIRNPLPSELKPLLDEAKERKKKHKKKRESII